MRGTRGLSLQGSKLRSNTPPPSQSSSGRSGDLTLPCRSCARPHACTYLSEALQGHARNLSSGGAAELLHLSAELAPQAPDLGQREVRHDPLDSAWGDDRLAMRIGQGLQGGPQKKRADEDTAQKWGGWKDKSRAKVFTLQNARQLNGLASVREGGPILMIKRETGGSGLQNLLVWLVHA